MLKNFSTEAQRVNVSTADLSRAVRFRKAA